MDIPLSQGDTITDSDDDETKCSDSEVFPATRQPLDVDEWGWTFSRMRDELRRCQRHIDLQGLCSSKYYWSDVDIWDLLTYDVVRALFEDTNAPFSTPPAFDADEAARVICGLPRSHDDQEFTSYRKVFAILIILEKQTLVFDCMKHNLDDSKLPFVHLAEWERSRAKTDTVPDCQHCRQAIPVFRSWQGFDVQCFDQHQWALCPAYFQADGKEKEKQLHYKFPQSIVLPIRSVEKVSRGGTFGTVFCVELDQKQHELPIYTTGSGKQLFAIKKLNFDGARTGKWTAREVFQNEANFLSRISSDSKLHSSQHLARLSATFEIESSTTATAAASASDFYFVFPCADMNLWDFWQDPAAPLLRSAKNHGPRMARWLAEQFAGLTEALKIIQQFFDFKRLSDDDDRWHKTLGTHGDIKAENILLFRNWRGSRSSDSEFGVLQIADFGLARFHSGHTAVAAAGTNTPPPQMMRRGHAYCAPEVEVFRRCDEYTDLWALGCLFLDFLVWYVHGPEGQRDFNRDRTGRLFLSSMELGYFYEMGECRKWEGLHYKKTLKIQIHKGVQRLYESDRSTQFLTDMLEFIPSKMLVLADHHQPPVVAGRLEGEVEGAAKTTSPPPQGGRRLTRLERAASHGVSSKSPRRPRPRPDRRRPRSVDCAGDLRHLFQARDDEYFQTPVKRKCEIAALRQKVIIISKSIDECKREKEAQRVPHKVTT
ncbi:kinase-like domain-containing protein [Xylariomycetidae sp. FL2044]|nr:kinase-like domain-containing protein [Xylariomycetidae sp. FL2044]